MGKAPATIADDTVLAVRVPDTGKVTFAGPTGTLLARPPLDLAVVVVLLNAHSFASLAYIANRKGYHAMAALAAAGAWLFGVTGGVLIWGIWR